MNFGKYLSLIPFEYHFEKEPDWYWRIRAVTAEDELAKDRFWSENTDIFNDIPVPPAGWRVMVWEVVRTFAGTNIPKDDKSVEDGGKPILSDSANNAQVEAIVKQMPPDMVFEIWQAVGEVNPYWGPAKKAVRAGEESSDQGTSDGKEE